MSVPVPPADLAERRPERVRLPAGTDVHRFYTAQFEPVHCQRFSEGRLNTPDGSYGALCQAREPVGAFAQTFLRQPGPTLIDTALLSRKTMSACA